MTDRRLPIGRTTSTTITLGGRELLSFAGCDYLGLAHHPLVHRALCDELAQSGLSTGASRETTGNRLAHEELERDLARFLGVESALLAPNGYLANLIAAQGLAPDHACALVDAEAHASIRDALRATSMQSVTYPHADAGAVLRRGSTPPAEAFVVFTDSVFPASPVRFAPLPELLQAIARFPARATLVVDDCHGLGVLGECGRGSLEHFGLADPRIVVTGTLSKALGAHGGFIAGTRKLVEAIRDRSLAYVCASPIPAAVAKAASAALSVLQAEPQRLAQLREHTAFVAHALRELELSTATADGRIPVFCFSLDPRERLAAAQRKLEDVGLFVPLVHYPDQVAGEAGSFRLTLSAAHTREDVERLVAALRSVCQA